MRHTPKKSLGQNFLRDGHARRRIVDSCAFLTSDTVLEIGPGMGALTPLIAGRVRRVYAVELDHGLAVSLQERFGGSGNIVIRQGDILKFDLSSIPESRSVRLKVIGNIPYYITTPIIEHLLGERERVGEIFLTVQKEFARRICAAPGTKEYGAFSCYVQYHTVPAILFDIKKNSFYPVPKVDSSFIRLTVRERPAVRVADEPRLFAIIHAAFQQRRKTLRNSLRGLIAEDAAETFFSCRGIDSSLRPEKLSLQDFAVLANPC